MLTPMSHGLQVDAGASASNAGMGSGSAAFANHNLDPALRGRESPRTPAPRGLPPASFEGSRSGVEMLLLEQNQVLMKQLEVFQSQLQSSQVRLEALSAKEVSQSKLFQPHGSLLEGVDPALQKVFEAFEKEARHTFEAWETQKKLLEKYSKLSEESRLHNHLQSEADFKWQWTKLYLATAQPVSVEQDMHGEGYSVADSWARMRRKHAEECFQFVCQHQQQCVALYENQVSLPALKQRLFDQLDVWFAQQAYDDEALRMALKQRASQFVEAFVRATRPKIQTRMAKDKDLQEKREQALLEAKSKWEEMDVKDVLSPALFELVDARQKRSVNIKADSALAFLVKDNEELCKKHNVKFVPGASSSSSSSKRALLQRKPPQRTEGVVQRKAPTPHVQSSSLQAGLPLGLLGHLVVQDRHRSKCDLKLREEVKAREMQKAKANRRENSA